MAEAHGAVWLPCPRFTHPDGALGRYSMRLRLVQPVEPPEYSGKLLFDRAAMTIEQGQRRTVAVQNATVVIGDQDCLGQCVQ
jgi:hypothetical protein